MLGIYRGFDPMRKLPLFSDHMFRLPLRLASMLFGVEVKINKCISICRIRPWLLSLSPAKEAKLYPRKILDRLPVDARRLLACPCLLLLNLVCQVDFIVRSPFFPPFPNKCLNTLELTEFVSWLESSTSMW